MIAVFKSATLLAICITGWDEWTECSKSCDKGVQSRMKYCNNLPCRSLEAICNAMPCYERGVSFADEFEMNEWSSCDKPCNNGTRNRTNEAGDTVQEIRCNVQSCDPAVGNCTADVIFVIDSSASINFMNWYVAKQFVMDVIQGLKVSEHQTRIGLVSYSTMVRLDILLGEYFTAEPDMLPEIWQTPYMAGVTNTADGILEMHKMFQSRKRPYVQQIGILLTDGLSNINHDEYGQER
ncbi:hypothetical protein NP493_550g05031 [Ridgeia piscesae]|uniref:VWFA domain-containing protein n=1 Tax=Ridgeia piscesae TaxID=27915 RepID=A0AAD9KVN7_RIDPI|nr:hypothetical protein NP493_550g05031 [Ridgeia piscesae]